ncbi:NADH-quinone oxidoreductase subunit NuoG [Candidatus Persebacteraceae bacterium Df01]|jgi:NADH-quinone oxidoreductase subunit G|uniref:NADH-quinone oxidoreductase n=1 Tax=Candidatus Doriopsillibacter californiensis TaxID=2970740 RepID=A0ABT7QMT2_9GAMM|nr:NADH-quinone oxidoreductase subunit NuoG [Candidatus Persebacteraceae bacterium Df01]
MDISLQINGQTISVRENATIMEAATQAGIYIPHFCYHPKLSIAANCRMCLVDVEKSPKPLPACATTALDGMVVCVDSHKAKEAQNSVMEFLLINHPLDCPICDQGGECQLQDLAVGYGMSKSRYTEEKRVVIEKNLGPLISTDMTRCIHCTRCVRFGREVGGVMEMGMTGRGEHAEIMPFVERTINSELSGNMIDVCPVGALTSKPFRFTARPWELTNKPSIAAHDSWGSRLLLQVKNGEVKRIKPAETENINQCWLSDRDRFSYLGLGGKRCDTPLERATDARRFEKVSWVAAKESFTQRLHATIKQYGADSIGFFASPHTTQEELFLLQKLARGIGCENIDNRLRQRDFSAADINGYGFEIKNIGRAGAVLFVGAEPARELPLLPVRFRKTSGKRRAMSIGAVDIGNQIPLAAQHLSLPSAIVEQLRKINSFLKITASRENSLFTDCPQPLRHIAEQLQNAKGAKHLLLGDAALSADNAGDIVQQAHLLAEGVNAQVGTLSSGANGTGAASAGFRPTNGLHTAAMLRDNLRAVVLYNCEAEDFAEQSLAREMLTNANFVAAFNTHTDGLSDYAHIQLPIAATAENEGTLFNGEGTAQLFDAAAKPPGQARPGWKILRLFGEALGISGFDFSTLEEVRQLLSRENKTSSVATDSTPITAAATGQKNAGFELVGGTSIYNTDILARRASALQKTAAGRAATHAYFHPDDMQTLGLIEGAAVRLTDAHCAWETVAHADQRLVRGVILAYPPTLRATRNIHAEAITTANTAAAN